MTKPFSSDPSITLPLLIAYVETLAETLAGTRPRSLTTDPTAPAPAKNEYKPLLWVVQTGEEEKLIRAHVKAHRSADKTAAQDTPPPNILTLSALMHPSTPERHELVCFWLPTLTAEALRQYIPLIMRHRDLYAAHSLIAIAGAIDLRPYGFTPLEHLERPSAALETDTPMQPSVPVSSPVLWQFNLYDYKQLPNWLNADYWANPENWGKHRW